MRRQKRIFVIVIDSLGIGVMPDGERFGDIGVNTGAYFGISGRFSDSHASETGTCESDTASAGAGSGTSSWLSGGIEREK